MLDRFSPYSLIDQPNPVFQQDQQHLHVLKTRDEMRRFNLLVWLVLPASVLLWWLLERLSYGFEPLPAELENRLILLVLYLSLGLMPVSGIFTAVAVVGPLNRLFHRGQWTLLRITNQPEAEILKAKDAISQIRVWPFFALESGLRITIVALLFLNLLYWRYHTVSFGSFVFFTLLNPLCWGVYSFLFVMGAIYIVEPILRMKIMVALCAVAAIRVRYPSFALLAGIAAIVFVHLIQAGLVGSVIYLYRFAFGQGNDDGAVFVVLCLLPLSILATFASVLLYRKVKNLTPEFIYKMAVSEERIRFRPSKVARLIADYWQASPRWVKKN